MRRCALGVIACVSLSAQAPRDLYVARCARCHGPSGEGSRRPALKVAALERANDPDSLVALLRHGIPGTEMAAIAQETVADEPLRGLAVYVLGLRTKAQDARSDRLGRGAELFRTKGKCLTCHRVNGEGHTSGPDLSDIGRLREPPWLREAVVDPKAALYDSTGVLSRIPSAGGAPTPATELAQGESTQRWPQILPGGKAVLFTSSPTGTAFDGANIEVMSLADRRRRTLQRGGTFGRYLPGSNGTGHLVYIDKGTLFAR